MKTDRLLSLVTYLLNRDLVSCSQLAEKFEVSERTIQRDMDTLNLAGIPVQTERGANGGYRILETYGLSKQSTGPKDLVNIRHALEAFDSALDDDNIKNTLEKVKSLGNNSKESPVRVDFSAANENEIVQGNIRVIKDALEKEKALSFSYTNGEGFASLKTIEPLLLEYRWHAWYLLGYDKEKREYRIYKVVRMEDPVHMSLFSRIIHKPSMELFEKVLNQGNSHFINLVFLCEKDTLSPVREYLNGVTYEMLESGRYRCRAQVIEKERFWFAILLSLGDDIQVLSPGRIRDKIIEHSRKILDSYK